MLRTTGLNPWVCISRKNPGFPSLLRPLDKSAMSSQNFYPGDREVFFSDKQCGPRAKIRCRFILSHFSQPLHETKTEFQNVWLLFFIKDTLDTLTAHFYPFLRQCFPVLSCSGGTIAHNTFSSLVESELRKFNIILLCLKSPFDFI